MHALAVLGPFLRKELGACSLVGGLPGRAVVGGAEYANGGNSDEHLARLRVIDDNGMQTKPARAGMPLGPRGMVCQSGHFRPGFALVVAAEERGGRDACV